MDCLTWHTGHVGVGRVRVAERQTKCARGTRPALLWLAGSLYGTPVRQSRLGRQAAMLQSDVSIEKWTLRAGQCAAHHHYHSRQATGPTLPARCSLSPENCHLIIDECRLSLRPSFDERHRAGSDDEDPDGQQIDPASRTRPSWLGMAAASDDAERLMVPAGGSSYRTKRSARTYPCRQREQWSNRAIAQANRSQPWDLDWEQAHAIFGDVYAG